MRLVATPALLWLTAAMSVSPAIAADDVIVNGLHCNQLCQSWLGVGHKSGEQAAESPRLVARHELRPIIALPPVQARRSATVVVASVASPSQDEAAVDIAPSPAPSMAYAATRPLSRAATVPMAPTPRSRGMLTASREVVPPVIAPSAPRLAPEPTVRIAPPVSAPPALVRAEPASTPAGDAPDANPPTSVRARAAEQASSWRGSSPQREASFEVGEPVAAPDDARPAPQQRALRRSTPATSNLKMEAGLTTLPRLDTVVATHGTIMIETNEDRVLAKRQMADLIKATTRPKQFKTGFIGQPSTEENASRVATGTSE